MDNNILLVTHYEHGQPTHDLNTEQDTQYTNVPRVQNNIVKRYLAWQAPREHWYILVGLKRQTGVGGVNGETLTNAHYQQVFDTLNTYVGNWVKVGSVVQRYFNCLPIPEEYALAIRERIKAVFPKIQPANVLANTVPYADVLVTKAVLYD